MKQPRKKTGFTIIELLTVMSIIVILISLLVPSLNMVKRFARKVRQKAQFHSIDAAMELFHNEWDGYPPSGAQDEVGQEYCGAMKFCEAMVGQDLMGFHPSSHFRSDLTDGTDPKPLYDRDPTSPADDPLPDNIKAREGPYIQIENANAYRLWHLYGKGNTGPAFSGVEGENLFVLCDVYARVTSKDTGKKIGMPILYYKADPSGNLHDPNDSPQSSLPVGIFNYYDYLDNHELLRLGLPWEYPTPTTVHPLFKAGGDPEGRKFYEITKNRNIRIRMGRPHRPDSYILISAGFDGLYGTEDDMFNFEK